MERHSTDMETSLLIIKHKEQYGQLIANWNETIITILSWLNFVWSQRLKKSLNQLNGRAICLSNCMKQWDIAGDVQEWHIYSRCQYSTAECYARLCFILSNYLYFVVNYLSWVSYEKNFDFFLTQTLRMYMKQHKR